MSTNGARKFGVDSVSDARIKVCCPDLRDEDSGSVDLCVESVH